MKIRRRVKNWVIRSLLRTAQKSGASLSDALECFASDRPVVVFAKESVATVTYHTPFLEGVYIGHAYIGALIKKNGEVSTIIGDKNTLIS